MHGMADRLHDGPAVHCPAVTSYLSSASRFCRTASSSAMTNTCSKKASTGATSCSAAERKSGTAVDADTCDTVDVSDQAKSRLQFLRRDIMSGRPACGKHVHVGARMRLAHAFVHILRLSTQAKHRASHRGRGRVAGSSLRRLHSALWQVSVPRLRSYRLHCPMQRLLLRLLKEGNVDRGSSLVALRARQAHGSGEARHDALQPPAFARIQLLLHALAC